MFDNICTFPLPSEAFSQALHPTEPLVALGLSSGHVITLRLPPVGVCEGKDNDTSKDPSAGCGVVKTEWKTKRHKFSCRCTAFSVDGEVLFTAGADGIVKSASALTGQVNSKIILPQNRDGTTDAPSALCALSPQTLLIGADSAALYIYDLRADSTFGPSRPQQKHHPHAEHVSSITPLPPGESSSSGYSKQWVTTGGSTIAVTDLRKGILAQSEDQEEDLLSSAYISGLPAKSGRGRGEKILVGEGGGVLTMWERGQWDDQQQRIIVDRGDGSGQSLDALAVMPEGLNSNSGRCVAVGMDDGNIRIVRLGLNEVIAELRHDEVDGVSSLEFDLSGRLVSSGGNVVKVWRETSQLDGSVGGATKRRFHDSDSDDIEVDSKEDVESDEKQIRIETSRKKQAKGKGKRSDRVLDFTNID